MIKYEIRGQDIFIPENNDINWGQDVTEAFGVIANNINSSATESEISSIIAMYGPHDIKDTEVTGLIENGQTNPIPTLIFNKDQVRASITELMVLRTGGSDKECAILNMMSTYDEDTNNWSISVDGSGHTDVEFDIDSNGQVTYKADNVGSTVFKVRFRARSMSL